MFHDVPVKLAELDIMLETRNAEHVQQIMARQLPDEEKRAKADFVVDTSGTLDETRAQVRNILTCLGLPTGV